MAADRAASALRSRTGSHGLRRRSAHDDRHEVIRTRRGRCSPCRKTFTILLDRLPPSSRYTFHCRRQACERIESGNSVKQAAPDCMDPARSPDPSTLRRWTQRRVLSVWCWLKTGSLVVLVQTPTRAPGTQAGQKTSTSAAGFRLCDQVASATGCEALGDGTGVSRERSSKATGNVPCIPGKAPLVLRRRECNHNKRVWNREFCKRQR